MPTYDYICDACGHEFEAFESIKADPQTVCPTCHEARLRRKIGPGAAILFKGSGFYQTDYRSDSYKKGAEADKSSGSPAKSSETKSADSSSSGSSNGATSPPPPAPTKTETPKAPSTGTT
jgi:putative FmdB family regulatory protein